MQLTVKVSRPLLSQRPRHFRLQLIRDVRRTGEKDLSLVLRATRSPLPLSSPLAGILPPFAGVLTPRPLARASACVSIDLVEVAALARNDAWAHRGVMRGRSLARSSDRRGFVRAAVGVVERAPVARLGRVGRAAVARGPAAGRRSSADAGAWALACGCGVAAGHARRTV